MLEQNRIEKDEKGTDFCENNQNTHMKSKLKSIIPIVAIILIAAIAISSIYSLKKEKYPNLAIYLQGTKLKGSYLDEVNPIWFGEDYVDCKSYDTAEYIGSYIAFINSDTIVYPLAKEDNYDYVQLREFNLKDGSSSESHYNKKAISEFYTSDGKYFYGIHDSYDKGVLFENVLYKYKDKNKDSTAINVSDIVFEIKDVSEILGVKQATGEVYYLKPTGTGKTEMYKTIKGKEIRVDSGITGFLKFYQSGESYYHKEDGLYYSDGENSKKIIAHSGDSDFYSDGFASDMATAAIAYENSLNIIVKDAVVKTINCATNPHNIVCSSDGKRLFYLANVHESGFYLGKVNYHNVNSMEVGDLYRISINDSNVNKPELYDTEVSKGTVSIESDGAVTYYKNYMLLSSIVDFDYPIRLDIGDFYVNKKLIGEKVNFVEYVSQNEIYYICDVDNLKNVDSLVVKNVEDIENMNLIYPTLIEIESPKNFTSGTLKKYNGKQSVALADNVHEYYVKDNGQVLMLMNCNNEYLGELYLYNEKGNIFIDYDVTNIISVG